MASKYKLDLFKEVLPAIDRKNYNFYKNIDKEKKKDFAPTIAMRAASIGDDYMLWLINENANYDFYNIHDHPELQYKLLASCGRGKTVRHGWINIPKQTKNLGELEDFFLKYWSNANNIELEIIFNSFTKETFREFVNGCGLSRQEEKKLIAKFDKL